MTTNNQWRSSQFSEDEFIDELAQQSFALIPDFLDGGECASILEHIKLLKADDDFKKAGIGKQLNFTIKKNLRGDFIKWIKAENEPQIIQDYLQRIEFLKQLINRTCFLSLKDFEAHYTFYPTNTRYIKHRDRFQQNAHRLISVVCYLAPHWKPEDGGQLLIYNNGKVHEVLPEQGTLVCFKSELEHEVLLTNRERYSITGWLLDQPAKLTFL